MGLWVTKQWQHYNEHSLPGQSPKAFLSGLELLVGLYGFCCAEFRK